MNQKTIFILSLTFACIHVVHNSIANADELYTFTPADKQFLAQFTLSALPNLPAAPSNAVADNYAAALLGKQFFFDKRLSRNKQIACANCHQPEKYFTDGLSHSVALGISKRSAPSLLGAAWSPWQYWDGRKDSLWSQALAPLEHVDEHGISRTEVVALITHYYADQYRLVFGDLPNDSVLSNTSLIASPLGNEESKINWQALPTNTQQTINRIFSNVGKALMAYQRQLKVPPAKFDHFVNAVIEGNNKQSKKLFNKNEVSGLRLFMGRANCTSCHNGPLFTNFEFHNIGAPESNESRVDLGRFDGVSALINDEFTCLSVWSDANSGQCEEMQFLKRKGPELVGAFKTPTLRNIAATAPYMQTGQFQTLTQALAHYNLPKPPFYDRNQHPNRPHFDVLPLQLSELEIQQVIAFLHTLTSPLPINDHWWSL